MTIDTSGQETIAALRSVLPLWDARGNASIELLSLSENAVYLIEHTSLGRAFVVRVHRSGYNTDAEIESELAWVRSLSKETTIKLAAPIRGTNGAFLQRLQNGNPAVAFEFVKGRKPAIEETPLHTFEELGTIAAQLHRHARSWPRAASFTRKTWDFQHCLGDAAIWGDWRAAPGLRGESIALLEPVVERLKARLESFGYGPDRFGLVHGDLKMANLLVDDEGLHLLDFDDCGLCWFLYDYGCAMTGLDAGPKTDALTQAWVSGYRLAGELTWEDEDMLPTFSLLRRVMTMAWAGSREDSPVAVSEYGARYSMETLAVAERYLKES